MNKTEAAEHLQVSTRAVERYTAKGRLTPRYEKDAGGRAVAVYDPEQVEKLRQEMQAATHTPGPRPVTRIPDKADNRDNRDRGAALALTRAGKSPALAELVAAIEAARAQARPAVPIADALMLTLAEAAQLSRLSRNHLRAAITEGKLKARIIGRGWRVKRSDLDAYVRKL